MGGVDKPVAGRNPGLLFVNSKITKPDDLSPKDYSRWYDEIHIPDIFKTSGIKEASRWQSVNSDDERPFLALYPLEELNFLNTDEFKGMIATKPLAFAVDIDVIAIPVHDEKLPGSHHIFDFADFDTRYYKVVQLFEGESSTTGKSRLVRIISKITDGQA